MLLGAKELQAQLRVLKKSVRNATRVAAYAGGVVYRDALRFTAPTTNATARRAITIKRTQGTQQGTGIVQVGTAGPAFYLNILSTGAKGHVITAGEVSKIINPKTRQVIGKRTKKRRVLAVSGRPGRQTTRGAFMPLAVWHPGISGRHWIRPTLDRSRDKALTAVGERYTEAIKQAVT